MTIEQFVNMFDHVLNEFRIVNEHFDSKTKSNTQDYDAVFFNWIRDMSRRYKDLNLNMHWATSSHQISKNQILFNARYKDEYFCEVKYNFDLNFVQDFRSNTSNFLSQFVKIAKAYQEFIHGYDLKSQPKTQDFDKAFSVWKKNLFGFSEDLVIDMHWANKNDLLVSNPALFTCMFRDDFLFEVKSKFLDPDELMRFSLLEENLP